MSPHQEQNILDQTIKFNNVIPLIFSIVSVVSSFYLLQQKQQEEFHRLNTQIELISKDLAYIKTANDTTSQFKLEVNEWVQGVEKRLTILETRVGVK